MTKTSREDIGVLIRRLGLSLSATQLDQIHDGWTKVEPMLERIRGEGRSDSPTPAPIFRADAFGHAADDTEPR